MAWAFKQKIPNPGAKLVLLALCDFADEAWTCFPGQRTLAEKTSQGERTVRRHLEWLEREGYIVSYARFAEGRRTSNRYAIHAPRPATPPPPRPPAQPPPSPGKEGQHVREPDEQQEGGKGAKQAAILATGQSGQRPDSTGEPAKLAGEPSVNHQENPLPPAAGDTAAGGPGGGCAAHPRAPAANCRGCGTSPRRRSAAAAAQAAREAADRERQQNQQWFEDDSAHRARVARLEEQGAVDAARRRAREALRSAHQRTPSTNK